MDRSKNIARSELKQLLDDLDRVCASVQAYNPNFPPPILDSSANKQSWEPHSGLIPGLRPFLESVMRDRDILSKFLADPDAEKRSPPSSNAPYLISVWKEILKAPAPIVAIGKTFYDGKPGRVRQPKAQGTKSSGALGAKVDVVADGGRLWIRVNTTKNSRLLAEFREIDSYATDSDSDSDSLALSRASWAQKEFDNSILRAGRALHAAARANTAATSEGPSMPNVIMRLIRLDPTSCEDPRAQNTVDLLRDIGITVELGECSRALPSVETSALSLGLRPTPTLQPTLRLNLDLSLLIALVTDLTHAPLPVSDEDAVARFTPSTSYIEWKRERLRAKRVAEGDDEYDPESDTDLINHSRALVEQVHQEMRRGLIQEIHSRVSSALRERVSDDPEEVEFWTTREARHRCIRIVEKIGGPRERRRVHALFPDSNTTSEQARQAFWQHSRYPPDFISLLPLHIYDSPAPPLSASATEPFAMALEVTCRSLLASHSTLPRSSSTRIDDPAFKDEIGRASVTISNPKLTTHTVQSMLWGVVRRCTTLTANRGSVRALLREMKSRTAMSYSDANSLAGDGAEQQVEHAVIWTVDPRSLAEGMRSDFQGEVHGY